MGSRIGVGVGPRSTEWGLALRVAACACMVVGIERITTADAIPVHAPAAPAAAVGAPAGCSFAQAGTGTFASTLCWLDLSAYNPNVGVEAGRPAHDRDAARRLHDHVQPARVRRAGGGDQFPDVRGCVPGKQRPLHRRFRAAGPEPDEAGTTTTATLDGITVTGPGGAPETGYAFVGADAESTDRQESITWTANTPFTLSGTGRERVQLGSRADRSRHEDGHVFRVGIEHEDRHADAGRAGAKLDRPGDGWWRPSGRRLRCARVHRAAEQEGVEQDRSLRRVWDQHPLPVVERPARLGQHRHGEQRLRPDRSPSSPAMSVPASRSQSRSPPGFLRTTRIRGRAPETAAPIRRCRPAKSDPRRRCTLGIGDFVDCTITNTSKSVRHRRCRRTRGCPLT